jgi:hypothetical protein
MTSSELKTVAVVAVVILATLYVNKNYLHVERLAANVGL